MSTLGFTLFSLGLFSQVADLLMGMLVVDTLQGTKVFLEVLELNQAFIELVGRVGLTKIWRTFRMHYRSSPNTPNILWSVSIGCDLPPVQLIDT